MFTFMADLFIATRPFRLLMALGAPFLLFVLCKAVLFPPYDDRHEAVCRTGAAESNLRHARLRSGPVYGPQLPKDEDVSYLSEFGAGQYCACDWGPLPLKYGPFKWMAVFSSLALSGALGATVSYYWRMSVPTQAGAPLPPSDEAVAARGGGTKHNIILLQMFGSVFAVVLFLMFLSGIVSGSVFPELSRDITWCKPYLGMRPWSGLLFWAFVSGFSERVVPGLIDRLADKLDGDDDIAKPINQPAP